MPHPSDESRPNDEQDPCGEAVRMTQALIADGIDPADLARAFRSRLLFFLVGTVANTNLSARWTDDPSLSSWEHASSAAEDQRPLAAQFEPPPRQVNRPGGSQPLATNPGTGTAWPWRPCENPLCDRAPDRDHRHCCTKCRNAHWYYHQRAHVHDRRCEAAYHMLADMGDLNVDRGVWRLRPANECEAG